MNTNLLCIFCMQWLVWLSGLNHRICRCARGVRLLTELTGTFNHVKWTLSQGFKKEATSLLWRKLYILHSLLQHVTSLETKILPLLTSLLATFYPLSSNHWVLSLGHSFPHTQPIVIGAERKLPLRRAGTDHPSMCAHTNGLSKRIKG